MNEMIRKIVKEFSSIEYSYYVFEWTNIVVHSFRLPHKRLEIEDRSKRCHCNTNIDIAIKYYTNGLWQDYSKSIENIKDINEDTIRNIIKNWYNENN